VAKTDVAWPTSPAACDTKGAAMNESVPGTDKNRNSKDGPDAHQSSDPATEDPKDTDHPTGVQQAAENAATESPS